MRDRRDSARKDWISEAGSFWWEVGGGVEVCRSGGNQGEGAAVRREGHRQGSGGKGVVDSMLVIPNDAPDPGYVIADPGVDPGVLGLPAHHRAPGYDALKDVVTCEGAS